MDKMKKYTQFINEEVGLRNISKIAKLHKTAEIYFHKDLDGVTSALAMKTFLKNYYQIETVDCHDSCASESKEWIGSITP